MSIMISDKLRRALGIIHTGPYTDTRIVHLTYDAGPRTAKYRHARNYVASWVEHWLSEENAKRSRDGIKPILRGPQPHMASYTASLSGKLTTTFVHGLHDYGDFAALSEEASWNACWLGYAAYCIACEIPENDRFSKRELETLARMMLPATATLVVTSDNDMVLADRDRSMLLHPGHTHCLGGAMARNHTSVVDSAVSRVSIETGIGASELHDGQCIAIVGNHPQWQPIFCVLLRTSLSKRQVVNRWPSAQDPDGRVKMLPFNTATLLMLSTNKWVTPSLRAFVHVIMAGAEQGILRI